MAAGELETSDAFTRDGLLRSTFDYSATASSDFAIPSPMSLWLRIEAGLNPAFVARELGTSHDEWPAAPTTLLDCQLQMVSPVQSLQASQRRKQRDRDLVHYQLQVRVEQLAHLASDEGIQISTASKTDLFDLIGILRPVRRPSVFLLDNGNFRALWKGPEGEQVGLQLLGSGEIQFVFFFRRPGSTYVTRIAGRDTLGGIRKQIAAHDLRRLLTA